MTEEKQSWLTRLKDGLSKSTAKITGGITSLLTKRKLDHDVLSELEDILILADLGPATSSRLVQAFGKSRFGKDVSDQEVCEALAIEMEAILAPCDSPLKLDPKAKPFVILMVGVNGAGKTTTIGKMAKQMVDGGWRVMMVAGDTFRAAAVSQLKVWGERCGCPIMTAPQGSDAAALAYQSLEKAKREGYDVLMIDTAGRLHNKSDLMAELSKISRVLKKIDPDAPHATLLVLDATTGQNAYAQVEVFKEMTAISGLVLTKLDGSAKGGVVVGLADKFKLPIHAVGVGERIDDLQPFDARSFSTSLMGVEP
ncbi:MAG: signal recognition particle-docking protein FtsY [Alphaproteobacteria bacterium]|jgi:fused signal recognition particle receptor|nr:signal recognition particle-docking protein FtsY [Alphaproteobacteria bacterium]